MRSRWPRCSTFLLVSSWAAAGLAAQSGLAEARKGLANADAPARIAAAQELGKLGTTPAAQVLFAALADP